MASGKKKSGSNRGVVMTVAVGAISVIMVLTMMLPSLSLIFSGRGSSAESSATTATPTTVEEADAKYTPQVSALKEQLDADPNSLAALANLGYAYFDWATSVRSLATSSTSADDASSSDAEATDTTQAHAEELFNNAKGYFDRYLALEDSASVRTSRVLCTYYLGDTEAATEELAAYAEESNFGPAWANLGMFYATAGDTDAAKTAFNAAIEADASDEYGSKSYAEQYLAYIEQIEQLTASLSTEGTTTTVGEDGTSIITLDSNGYTYDDDGNIVVAGDTSGSGADASADASATTELTTSAPTTTTDLKNELGGLF